MRSAAYETDSGRGWLSFDAGGGLVGLSLPGFPAPHPVESTPPLAIARLAGELGAYFDGTGPCPSGWKLIGPAARTPLDRCIYEVVCDIPAGSTMTYGEVAVAAGRPGAARAVGAAMARNPFPPMIPCHRVVGSDGDLRGYRGGTGMKQRLLRVEADSR